jgi:transcriptional regulator with XRE-family HTH domain
MSEGDKAYLAAFGERVRTLRKSRGFSQERLADSCQLDRTYIGGIERGERNITILKVRLIAQALEVPISEIFE